MALPLSSDILLFTKLVSKFSKQNYDRDELLAFIHSVYVWLL